MRTLGPRYTRIGRPQSAAIIGNVAEVPSGPVSFLTQPTITGVPGGILTGVNGTLSNGATPTRWWTADAVQVSTAATIDSNDPAYAGRALVYNNVYAPQSVYAASASVTYGVLGSQITIPYTAADGTQLDAYTYGGGTFVVRSGVAADATILTNRAKQSSALRLTWSQIPPSPEQLVFFDYYKAAANAQTQRILMRHSADSLEYYNVGFSGAGTLNLRVSSTTNETWGSGGTWTVPANGTSQRCYAKVTTLPNGDVTVSCGTAIGNAIDVEKASRTFDHVTEPTKIVLSTGFVGIGYSLSGTVNTYQDNMTFYIANDALLLGTPTSFLDASGRHITVPLTYTGTPTGYDIQFVAADGRVLLAFTAMTGTPSGGSASMSVVTNALELYEGVPVWLSVRQANDTTIYKTMAYTPEPLPSVLPMEMGMNEGFINSSMLMRNLYFQGSWRKTDSTRIQWRGYTGTTGVVLTSATGAGSTVKMDWDGTIYSTNGLGITVYRYTLTNVLQGTMALTLAPGVTLSALTGATSYTYNSVTGLGTITCATTSQTIAIDINVASIPVGGLKPILLPDADANPSRAISDPVFDLMPDIATWWRPMTPLDVNDADFIGGTSVAFPTIGLSEMWTGSALMGPLSVQNTVAAVNDMPNTNLYYNLNDLYNATNYTYIANYIATNLASDRLLIVEDSNELWNSSFDQWTRLRIYAARGGWNVPGATPGTLVPETIYSNGYRNSNTLTIPLSTGDKVFCAIRDIGTLVFQATGNFSIGQALPTTGSGDANFTLIYDNTQCETGSHRAVEYRLEVIKTTFNAEFDAVGRTRPKYALSVQSDNPTDLLESLNWGNGWATVDYYAMAHYWGHTIEMGSYKDGPVGWGPTDKDTLYTISVAHAAGLFMAAAPDVIDTRITDAVTTRQIVATAAVAAGNPKDKPDMIQYENGPWHVQFVGWPDTATLYVSTSTYVPEQFCLGSDGKTYINILEVNPSTTGAQAPPNATYWTEYWNAAQTVSFQAMSPLLSIQLFDYIYNSQDLADLDTYYYEQWQQKVGGKFMVFCRTQETPTHYDNYPATPTRSSRLQCWGKLNNEYDTALSGGSLNRKLKALVDFVASL